MAILLLLCLCKVVRVAQQSPGLSSSSLLSWPFPNSWRSASFAKHFQSHVGVMLLGAEDVGTRLASPEVQVLEQLGLWGLQPWQVGNEVQFASETLFASSWSSFSSSEDAMEYSKEFVTAVVLGKDLVPRQVGKWLNFLLSACCSVPESPIS